MSTTRPLAVSFEAFWHTYLRVPDPVSGDLVTPHPHREQQRFVGAMDARDTRGIRPFDSVLLHWAKKTSKSFTGGAAGLYHLIADPFETDDRLVGIASYDEEQSGIIFRVIKQIIERDPRLTRLTTGKDSRLKIYKTEIVYVERVRERLTGGTFTREHRLRALARDTKGTHGEPWSMVIRDEVWSEPDHSFSEALIPSPTRVCPLTVYLSYSGLRSLMKPGVPLHDLLQRAKAGDPSLFYSYIGGSGADASWAICPWIKPAWVEEQRRLFVACPSRFDRVILNKEVLADGDTLLSVAEVSAAIEPALVTGPGTHARRPDVYGGLDLGYANDHAALVLVRYDPDGRVIVEHVKIWKPDADQPVAFTAVEDHLVSLRASYNIKRLIADQWNAKLLSERLTRAGIPTYLVTVEQTRINEIITIVKGAFGRRLIRIPSKETFLIEQLESLRVLETRTPRRDLLKLAPSGSGPNASEHDDAAIALGLALCERWRGEDFKPDPRIGRVQIAEMPHGCLLANHFRTSVACYLWDRLSLPSDPLCRRECPGHQSVLGAVEAHRTRTGEALDPRTFLQRGLIQPNSFITTKQVDQLVRISGLI